jgi:hypothetical protein
MLMWLMWTGEMGDVRGRATDVATSVRCPLCPCALGLSDEAPRAECSDSVGEARALNGGPRGAGGGERARGVAETALDSCALPTTYRYTSYHAFDHDIHSIRS